MRAAPVFSDRAPPLPFLRLRPASDPLPFAREGVAGFHHGDAIEFSDGKTPGLWLKGTVTAALPRLKLIVIRVGDRHIDLNPLHHAHKIRKAKAPC
jgi:hypothetical protein